MKRFALAIVAAATVLIYAVESASAAPPHSRDSGHGSSYGSSHGPSSHSAYRAPTRASVNISVGSGYHGHHGYHGYHGYRSYHPPVVVRPPIYGHPPVVVRPPVYYPPVYHPPVVVYPPQPCYRGYASPGTQIAGGILQIIDGAIQAKQYHH